MAMSPHAATPEMTSSSRNRRDPAYLPAWWKSTAPQRPRTEPGSEDGQKYAEPAASSGVVSPPGEAGDDAGLHAHPQDEDDCLGRGHGCHPPDRLDARPGSASSRPTSPGASVASGTGLSDPLPDPECSCPLAGCARC